MRVKALATFVFLVLLVSSPSRAGEGGVMGIVDKGKVEAVLGPGWEANQALVIESEADIKRLPASVREMAAGLFAQVKPRGVTALGEISYSRTAFPLNTVNIRVFRFTDEAAADKWRTDKYETAQAAPQYRKSQQGAMTIYDYDAAGMKKRIVFGQTLMLTVGHIGEGDLQVRVIDNCVSLPIDGANP